MLSLLRQGEAEMATLRAEEQDRAAKQHRGPRRRSCSHRRQCSHSLRVYFSSIVQDILRSPRGMEPTEQHRLFNLRTQMQFYLRVGRHMRLQWDEKVQQAAPRAFKNSICCKSGAPPLLDFLCFPCFE